MLQDIIDMVVIGHTVIDRITFKGNDNILPGGSAPAVALSAVDTGFKVGIMTRIGKDFPKSWLEILNTNIDTEGVQIIDGKTTSINIDYSDNGNIKNIDILHNVSNEFGEISFPKKYLDTKIMHLCPLPIHDQLKLLKECSGRLKHAEISVDFNQVYEFEYKKAPNIIKEMLRYTDIVFPNEFEARSITKVNDVKEAAEVLYDMGPSIVIIKLGEKGSIVYDSDGLKEYPAKIIDNIVDPTGCGDAFIGGFLSTYSKTRDIEMSVKTANIMAAKKIIKKGAWIK